MNGELRLVVGQNVAIGHVVGAAEDDGQKFPEPHALAFINVEAVEQKKPAAHGPETTLSPV